MSGNLLPEISHPLIADNHVEVKLILSELQPGVSRVLSASRSHEIRGVCDIDDLEKDILGNSVLENGSDTGGIRLPYQPSRMFIIELSCGQTCNHSMTNIGSMQVNKLLLTQEGTLRLLKTLWPTNLVRKNL